MSEKINLLNAEMFFFHRTHFGVYKIISISKVMKRPFIDFNVGP